MNFKKGLFKKWFVTYLVFITISLAFIFNIYTLYKISLKDDIEKINITHLEQIKNIVDSQVTAIMQTVNTLCVHPKTLTVFNMDRHITTQERINIIETIDNIKMYTIANDLVESIDLFANKPNFLLTIDSLYQERYLELYSEEHFHISKSAFLKIVNQKYNNGQVVRLSHLLKDEYNYSIDPLLYLVSYPFNQKGLASATLIVEINEKKLDEYLGAKELSRTNSYLVIIDKYENLLYSAGELKLPDFLSYQNLTDNQVYQYEMNGQKLVAFSVTSKTNNWKYIRIISLDSYMERVVKLNQMTIGSAILLTVISLLLAYYFSYKSYKPVKKIIKAFNSVGDIETKNEYEYIESIMSRNKISETEMEKKIYKQSKAVFDAGLIKILKGQITERKKILEILSEAKEMFQNEHSIVFLIYNDMSLFEDKQLILFIIQNIFDEILSAYYRCTFIEVDEMIGCIINCSEAQKDIEQIEGHILMGVKWLKERFDLQLKIGISQWNTDALELATAYEESAEALDYNKMMGVFQIIRYEYLQLLQRRYEFSLEQENILSNHIRLGQYDEAKQVIEEILNKNFATKQLRRDSVLCLMFDILSSIFKTADTKAQQDILDEAQPITKMMSSDSMEDKKQVIENVLQKICLLNKEHYDLQLQSKVVDEIRAYIKQNYSNPDLNVTHLGEVFNLTPAYLSKLYKRDTSDMLLDAINQMRLDAAKELLVSTAFTLDEITKMVGYTYSNAFIRFFKKQTGITPGQYRLMNKN